MKKQSNALSIPWEVRGYINAHLQREFGKAGPAQFAAFSIINGAIRLMKKQNSTTAVVVPWSCHVKEDAWDRQHIPAAVRLLKNTEWLDCFGDEKEVSISLSQKYLDTIAKFNKGHIRTLGLEQDNVYGDRKGITQANGRDWVDMTEVDKDELASRLKKHGRKINEGRKPRP